jgi:hypothetical protein
MLQKNEQEQGFRPASNLALHYTGPILKTSKCVSRNGFLPQSVAVSFGVLARRRRLFTSLEEHRQPAFERSPLRLCHRLEQLRTFTQAQASTSIHKCLRPLFVVLSQRPSTTLLPVSKGLREGFEAADAPAVQLLF